jgi:hypothetical protein
VFQVSGTVGASAARDLPTGQMLISQGERHALQSEPLFKRDVLNRSDHVGNSFCININFKGEKR